MSIVYCLLSSVYSLLSTVIVYCILSIAYCLYVYCPLSIVHCLLSIDLQALALVVKHVPQSPVEVRHDTDLLVSMSISLKV